MDIKEISRKLRYNSTPAELLFWESVRKRHIKGKRFLRQFPIVFDYEGRKRCFIADFYCAEVKLIVEINGKIHENQKEYDASRTVILNLMNFRVLRFKNDEILSDLENVLKKLEEFL